MPDHPLTPSRSSSTPSWRSTEERATPSGSRSPMASRPPCWFLRSAPGSRWTGHCSEPPRKPRWQTCRCPPSLGCPPLPKPEPELRACVRRHKSWDGGCPADRSVRLRRTEHHPHRCGLLGTDGHEAGGAAAVYGVPLAVALFAIAQNEPMSSSSWPKLPLGGLSSKGLSVSSVPLSAVRARLGRDRRRTQGTGLCWEQWDQEGPVCRSGPKQQIRLARTGEPESLQ